MCSKPIDSILTSITQLVDTDTAKVIDFIHTENCIWREIHGGKRPRFTEHQRRRLVKAAVPIRDRLDEFATLVQPETILRWYWRLKQKKWGFSRRGDKPGRPTTLDSTVQLVLRLADENGWGYKRIQGELQKLGHGIGSTTVARILKAHGYPIAPDRKGMSWKDFTKAHMDVTWAADMFTEEIITFGGLLTVYVLFFIHLGTRRVHIAGCTANPNADWMKQQARQFQWIVRTPIEDTEFGNDRPICRFLVHDRNSSFLPLDWVLKSQAIEIKRTPVQAPNANAFAERFVREARETLDNLIVFGEAHLRHVLKRIERHHNEQRPHQGIGNRVPMAYDYPQEPALPDDVLCSSELGGLLRHYHVEKAA